MSQELTSSQVVQAPAVAGETPPGTAASYAVLLLPRYEVVAHGLSFRDASAWVRTYNETLQGEPAIAVLAEECARMAA